MTLDTTDSSTLYVSFTLQILKEAARRKGRVSLDDPRMDRFTSKVSSKREGISNTNECSFACLDVKLLKLLAATKQRFQTIRTNKCGTKG